MPPAKLKNKANGYGLRSASLEANVSADNLDIQQTSNQPGAAAGRSREIPDSQEDPDDALSDSDQAADLGGYDTEEDDTPADVKRALVSGRPAGSDQAAGLGGYDTEEDETPAHVKRALVSGTSSNTKKAVYVSMVVCYFYCMPNLCMPLSTCLITGLCLPCWRMQSRSISASWHFTVYPLLIVFVDFKSKRN